MQNAPSVSLPSKKDQLWGAMLIALASGCIFCGYESLRSPSNTLFTSAYGPEKLGLIMAMTPLCLLPMLYGYGRLLSFWGPKKTLLTTSLICCALILCLYFLIRSGWIWAPAVLYTFRQAYIVILAEQYWSFIDSRLSADLAKRINGFIAGIGSLGGILGGYLVKILADPIGTESLLPISAAVLLPAAVLAHLAYGRCGEPTPEKLDKDQPRTTLGLGRFKAEPILVRLLLLVAVTQVFSAIVTIRFQTQLYQEIPSLNGRTACSGGFYSSLNLASSIMQFVAAPLAMSFLPLVLVQGLIPVVHLIAALFVLFHPSLGTCSAAFLLFKSLDYSLFKTSKEIFYMPLSFDARYRAKELIDVFIYRFGKGASALFISLFQNAGYMAESAFSGAALAVSLVWLGLIFPLVSAWRRTPQRQESSPTRP